MTSTMYERPAMIERGSFADLTRQRKWDWGWDYRRHRRRQRWC